MEFEAYFANKNEITRSAYAFDFKGQDGVLTPNDEKNMLNEMIHQALHHWAQTILENRSAQFKPYNFPDHRRGDFSGKDVECRYEIFYRK